MALLGNSLVQVWGSDSFGDTNVLPGTSMVKAAREWAAKPSEGTTYEHKPKWAGMARIGRKDGRFGGRSCPTTKP